MTILVFWLPMPPKEGTNASYSGHWATRRKQTKAYLSELDYRQTLGLLPDPPDKPFQKAELKVLYCLKSRRHFMDRDNRTARLKRVNDWLKTRGYIVEDDDEHLIYQIPDQVVRTREMNVPDLCSVSITLTQLDND